MRAKTSRFSWFSFAFTQPGKAWLSFFCFFFLLTSYFVLRPVRDQIGVAHGIDQLPWLFTGTFLATFAIVPCYALLVNTFARAKIALITYLLSLLLLVAAYFLMEAFPVRASVGLFIWISVYNVFIVSVFWTVMADLFARSAAMRSYGFIAAGGTLGALAGPALSMVGASYLRVNQLILLSVLLLATGLIFVYLLTRNSVRSVTHEPVKPLWSGIRSSMFKPGLRFLMVFIFCYSLVSTIIYFSQSLSVGQHLATPELRTKYCAAVDLCINGVALILQLALTRLALRNFQTSKILSAVPLMIAVLFLAVGMSTSLAMVTLMAIAHRAGHFSFLTPVRESLFTLVSYDDKYKSKNFIDTIIFRGSDAVSGWAVSLLFQAHLSWMWLGVVGFALAVAWGVVGYFLGRRFE